MRLVVTDEAGLPERLSGDGPVVSGRAVFFRGDASAFSDELAAAGVEVVPVVGNEEGRKAFLHGYVNLVSAVGRDLHSREWWATHLASRNRFNSRLPQLLAQVSAVRQAVEDGCDRLFAVGVMPEVIRAVRAMGVTVEVCGGAAIRHSWSESSQGYARWVGELGMGLLRVMWRRRRARQTLLRRITAESADISPRFVVKTFIYPHSFSEDGGYTDTAFGDLVERLKAVGERVIVYGLVLKEYGKCVDMMAACRAVTVLPVEMQVGYGDLFRAAARLLCRRQRVCGEFTFAGAPVSGLINGELARAGNGTSPYQYFHHAFVLGLLRTFRVKTFLQTCENNPWERMCIMALRENSPETRILGYQHAVVPQASANMFPGDGETEFAPTPDVILTTGTVPLRIMSEYGAYDADRLKVACGLKYEYLRNVGVAGRRRHGRTVLLALEGVPEVSCMVEYVLRQIGALDYEIVIRTHPVLPFAAIATEISRDLLAGSKYRVSNGVDLKTDIENSDVVVYWGTTVAMEALKAGKPVINFDAGSVLSYDPLFECTHLKWRVTAGDDLCSTLEEVFAMSDVEFEAARNRAARYIDEYFHAVTPEGLAPFTE